MASLKKINRSVLFFLMGFPVLFRCAPESHGFRFSLTTPSSTVKALDVKVSIEPRPGKSSFEPWVAKGETVRPTSDPEVTYTEFATGDTKQASFIDKSSFGSRDFLDKMGVTSSDRNHKLPNDIDRISSAGREPTTIAAILTTDANNRVSNIMTAITDSNEPMSKSTNSKTDTSEPTSNTISTATDNSELMSYTTSKTTDNSEPTSYTTSKTTDHAEPTSYTTSKTIDHAEPTSYNTSKTTDNADPTSYTTSKTTYNSEPTSYTTSKTIDNSEPTSNAMNLITDSNESTSFSLNSVIDSNRSTSHSINSVNDSNESKIRQTREPGTPSTIHRDLLTVSDASVGATDKSALTSEDQQIVATDKDTDTIQEADKSSPPELYVFRAELVGAACLLLGVVILLVNIIAALLLQRRRLARKGSQSVLLWTPPFVKSACSGTLYSWAWDGTAGAARASGKEHPDTMDGLETGHETRLDALDLDLEAQNSSRKDSVRSPLQLSPSQLMWFKEKRLA
ncbi:hypothetical protein EGW08_004917 [Elysia chlorotica]|uniref:Uncharacterized protein n=1 Tax=Elysia chlorotica TaxID=188477 RepID=A0A433U0J2_ELYCH|nr:hypothetical protein EGW08_004917 [Elysia chlorotica]